MTLLDRFDALWAGVKEWIGLVLIAFAFAWAVLAPLWEAS